jgi:hypothetical protein
MGGISYKLENAIERGVADPGQNVIVKVKSWQQSLTVIINGSLLVASTLIQLIDIMTGNNALEPILKLFIDNPEGVSNAITGITQFYTGLNLYLRVFKTSQPISK